MKLRAKLQIVNNDEITVPQILHLAPKKYSSLLPALQAVSGSESLSSDTWRKSLNQLTKAVSN
jgi:hypothetical protein